jgi:hypothetical protein
VFPTGDAIVLIQGGYDIAFSCKAPTPMLLQVHLRPELQARLKAPEDFRPIPPFRFAPIQMISATFARGWWLPQVF